MSSAEENTRKDDTQPAPDQPAPDAARRRGRRGEPPPKPKPAGMKALEQALAEAGKELKDLT
ncbi:hypothetical protein [Nonomuraea sp. NPDC050786]|uniref:hypothetical protein n=1 Tax=Nonomuraea sp. NPDC050786 TaxID=3154840 RepID=UPI0034112C68